jgi:hypothetical protein
MLRESFVMRLSALTAVQENETTELVDEYLANVARVHAVGLQQAQSGASAGRARAVISELEETSARALSQIIPEQRPVPDADMLCMLVDGVAYAEAAVTQRLKAALRDTRYEEQTASLRLLEEAAPPSRVCDEAYLALRRILNPESFLQFLMETRHFLSLAPTAKSHEIDIWLKTGAFARFLDDVDAEE